VGSQLGTLRGKRHHIDGSLFNAYRGARPVSSPPIFMVLLRRPKKNDIRTDPFYEFGSFGLTGCHRSNLLHPRNAPRLNDARLAFIQGGDGGARLICLTPPVTVVMHGDNARAEVTWNKDDPSARFMRYENAPIVTKTPEIGAMLEGVNRPTDQSRLASKFRTQTKPLPFGVAESLVRIHSESFNADQRFADRYEQTLPFRPDIIDDQRKESRAKLLREAKGEMLPPVESGQSNLGKSQRSRRPSRCR
jgi:hypothetical protein